MYFLWFLFTSNEKRKCTYYVYLLPIASIYLTPGHRTNGIYNFMIFVVDACAFVYCLTEYLTCDFYFLLMFMFMLQWKRFSCHSVIFFGMSEMCPLCLICIGFGLNTLPFRIYFMTMYQEHTTNERVFFSHFS